MRNLESKLGSIDLKGMEMATTTADMPLSSELSLVNYLRNITGTSSSGTATASQVASTPTVTAAQADELTSDELSSIMTEWLRGNGNLLGNMRDQNLSGLYNTSTQRLVANDLTAQAALKAATANSAIKQSNASLATNASVTNAQVAAQNAQMNANLATQVSIANAKAGTSSRTDSLVNTALAAVMNAYKSSGNKKAKTAATSSASQDVSSTPSTFDQAFSASQADTNFLTDSSYQNSSLITDPSYDFGASVINDSAASYAIPELASVDMSGFDTPSVMTFGQDLGAGNTYDFSSIGTGDYSTGSDFSVDTGGDFSVLPSVNFDDDSFSFDWSWSF